MQRTTRHVDLTPVGTRVLAAARQVLDDVSHLQRIVIESRQELGVGYAWAALGRHTRRVQKTWAATHPGARLILVQSNTGTAGLAEGVADIAVVRRPIDDPRSDTALVGEETRYAAMATDNRLARRRFVRLSDVARYPIAIDVRTGTTTRELWPADARPTAVRATGGLDEWLTLIAAGQAVGITSEATANQNPRPGVAYRTVRDAPSISVWLVWWKDDPPRQLEELVDLTRRTYQEH